MARRAAQQIGLVAAAALSSQMIGSPLKRHGLFVMGSLHDGDTTLILIGADTGFWQIFKGSDEYADGAPDPVDRWSKRIIGGLARALKGSAVFPSDGPPYAPFIAWAEATGRFWPSPTGMLVHDVAGLMISIRGAMRVPGHHPLTPATRNPCDSCADKPCIAACPVDALSDDHFYDVPACKEFLATAPGQTCMLGGCRVRVACPVSQSFDRDPAQSAFHMTAFVGGKT